MSRLALLTMGFVVADSILFAAISVSSQSLFAFPVIVSVWIAFLIVLIKQAVLMFSTAPHPPERVTRLVVVASVVATAALGVAIIIGLILLRATAPA